MYTAFENLELIKEVSKYGLTEEIYKVKNSTKDEFAIILESIIGLYEDVVNCSTHDSLEEAEEEAYLFLGIQYESLNFPYSSYQVCD